MKIEQFDRQLIITEHRVKILIQKVNRLDQEIEKVRVKYGSDGQDRSEGGGIAAATGPAGPQNGSGSAGAIAAAGVRVSQIQSQTAAEGGA